MTLQMTLLLLNVPSGFDFYINDKVSLLTTCDHQGSCLMSLLFSHSIDIIIKGHLIILIVIQKDIPLNECFVDEGVLEPK